MNELQTFNFNQTQVRTVLVNNEPWFVGKDVAEILGYQNPSKALADHVDSEDKLNNESLSSLGQRGGWIINESGLYSLILSSKLPSAKEFKRWVTSEVLPAIRKTGGYHMPATYKEALLQLVEQVEANEKLALENKEMKPKADYFDELVDRNLLTNFRDTAKELGLKQNEFISMLIEDEFVYRDQKNKLKPYSKKVVDGLFELKEFISRSSGKADVQTLITPKGRETFRLLYAS